MLERSSLMKSVVVFLLSVCSLAAGAQTQAKTQAQAQAPTAPKHINILWGDFTRPWSLRLVAQELQKPIKTGTGASQQPAAKVSLFDLTELSGVNPFFVTKDKPHFGDFFVGQHLPYPPADEGPVPAVTEKDAAWFDQMVATGQLPDVFIVGGHQVISEGWHNDAETEFMYLPTLLQTINSHPSARKFFDHIRLAILFGCNTMTNLEPHGPNGEYLSPEQIKAIYDSGPAGKAAMLGSAAKVNTLEFYRARLAREYGPDMGEHYEYTRDRKAEKCLGPGPYDHCLITDLDRILPDHGLWDGTHRYNYPFIMKRLFPNAVLVMGFSSASPSEETRVNILKWTFNETYKNVDQALQLSPASKGKSINNILLPLVEDEAPIPLKKTIISALRKNWTEATFKMNRQRPSGSISPVFPDLEHGNILGIPALANGSPQYGPYEAAPVRIQTNLIQP